MSKLGHAKWLALAAIGASLGLVGCKKNEPAAETSEPAVAAPSEAAIHAATSKEEAQPLDLPLLEDFEEQAKETVTATNLESEIDKLEKEIDAPE